ncbi:hypothetical protein DIPPA_35575 [Diplonema papillatum]|nr:hypothetical protein DIPPA_35575 [Diplonema papillatum]
MNTGEVEGPAGRQRASTVFQSSEPDTESGQRWGGKKVGDGEEGLWDLLSRLDRDKTAVAVTLSGVNEELERTTARIENANQENEMAVLQASLAEGRDEPGKAGGHVAERVSMLEKQMEGPLAAGEVADLKCLADRLSDEKSVLGRRVAHVETLHKEAQERNSALETEKERLQHSVATYGELVKTKKNELKAKIQALEARVRQLEAENTQLQAVASRVPLLEEDNRCLRAAAAPQQPVGDVPCASKATFSHAQCQQKDWQHWGGPTAHDAAAPGGQELAPEAGGTAGRQPAGKEGGHSPPKEDPARRSGTPVGVLQAPGSNFPSPEGEGGRDRLRVGTPAPIARNDSLPPSVPTQQQGAALPLACAIDALEVASVVDSASWSSSSSSGDDEDTDRKREEIAARHGRATARQRSRTPSKIRRKPSLNNSRPNTPVSTGRRSRKGSLLSSENPGFLTLLFTFTGSAGPVSVRSVLRVKDSDTLDEISARAAELIWNKHGFDVDVDTMCFKVGSYELKQKPLFSPVEEPEAASFAPPSRRKVREYKCTSARELRSYQFFHDWIAPQALPFRITATLAEASRRRACKDLDDAFSLPDLSIRRKSSARFVSPGPAQRHGTPLRGFPSLRDASIRHRTPPSAHRFRSPLAESTPFDRNRHL